MKLKARAKINLFLHVIDRLPNGYHEVETVIQPLTLSDVVDVKRIKKGIRISSNADIPLDENNSAYKAVKRLGVDGVKIHIHKNIPLAGGLGGSAVDAAPVLKILGRKQSLKKLVKIAGSIAADAPQALFEKPSLGTGIGTNLKIMPKLGKEFVLLTDVVGSNYYKNKKKSAYLYSKIDGIKIKHSKKLNEMKKALKRKNWKEIGKSFENDFEKIVFKDYPKIEKLKEELEKTNPDVCGMSGAGSVVFALYSRKKDAFEAQKKIRKKFRCWTLLTSTI